MRNESVMTVSDYKQQIIRQIKASNPNANISEENISIKIKLKENEEPIDFYALQIVVNV